MKENISNMLKEEENIKACIELLIKKIDQNISSGKREGVKKISKNMCSVKLSKLENNWSPEYHLSSSQARYVSEYLQKSNTMADFIARINKMIETEYAYGKNRKLKLNPYTISILKSYKAVFFDLL